MPHWISALGPVPRKAWYAVMTTAAIASSVIIAITTRSTPIPWQAIALGTFAALVTAACGWIGDRAVATFVAGATISIALRIGHRIYHTDIRGGSSESLQLFALIILFTVIAIMVADCVGVVRKRATRTPGGTEIHQ